MLHFAIVHSNSSFIEHQNKPCRCLMCIPARPLLSHRNSMISARMRWKFHIWSLSSPEGHDATVPAGATDIAPASSFTPKTPALLRGTPSDALHSRGLAATVTNEPSNGYTGGRLALRFKTSTLKRSQLQCKSCEPAAGRAQISLSIGSVSTSAQEI